MVLYKYKQKCNRCKKNYVVTTWRNKYPVCYDCQKTDMEGEINDPKVKKLLDIPEEFYEENAFLRSIKINAVRFQNLSEKQIEAFKKAVAKMMEENGMEVPKEYIVPEEPKKDTKKEDKK